MSWPLASFTLVGLVLLVGWLAYERARPSARMVAVVATLAAVAALGRDAFVALPDVKPITAITLVVGYALGPLPGFSVGAVGMLASNVMLGQGSYTPWQMAAWGLVGLIGAALGRLSGRRLGRFPLALACAFTALLAKEIMNVYTWTIGATHTPAAFLLVVAGALPFDVTDVVASFLFGLAFAPELARVLARVRSRMDIRWEPAGAITRLGAPAGRVPLAVLALGLVCALALPGESARAFTPRSLASTVRSGVGASSDPAAAVTHASAARVNLSPEVAYLASTQNADGGWGAAAGQPTSELYSAWAAIGLAAAGRNPQSVRRDGHTVLDALRAQAGTLEDAGDYERTMLALRACGAPVTSLAGKNLLAGLLRYRESDGSFAHQVNLTAFAVLALRAAGDSAGDLAVRAAGAWIARQQDGDGGFNFDVRGGSSDVDDTAAALQALVASGIRSGAGVGRAVTFLLHAQNLDGGFPEQPGGESNAQSTAWAVQGLVAAGRDVEADPPLSGAVRRSATCRASSPPTAACATRAPARKPRCGSQPRRSPRWRGHRSRSGSPSAFARRRASTLWRMSSAPLTASPRAARHGAGGPPRDHAGRAPEPSIAWALWAALLCALAMAVTLGARGARPRDPPARRGAAQRLHQARASPRGHVRQPPAAPARPPALHRLGAADRRRGAAAPAPAGGTRRGDRAARRAWFAPSYSSRCWPTPTTASAGSGSGPHPGRAATPPRR